MDPMGSVMVRNGKYSLNNWKSWRMMVNHGESWWNNWNMSMVTMVSNSNDGEKLTILAIFMVDSEGKS